ncbi:unnamed protein product [Brassicogethes aeneus]|uniref:Replication termination factor 2 n=1 Tax=Brassicogethes aeneus TaxID=1431903 RepID=A0A9P0FIT0_BRAAE|nr:unnamed protein product [Brassicogethes aeneus]
MGCDGGTIPRRDELVKVKKKPETKDKDAELAFLWQCCTITQEILQKPIVVCHMGKLYSKMALIEALLDRSTLPEGSKYIRNLKDVKDLNLTPNPEFNADERKKEGAIDHRAVPYICPVLGLEMNGKHRFVALWSCGCTFSERAYKEIGTKNCHKCTKPFEDDDVVIINGNEDDLELMLGRMEIRQQKNKKNKERKTKVKQENSDSGEISTNNIITEPSSSKQKRPTLVKEDVPKKKIRTIGNVVATGKVMNQEELKKMKPEYSIAKDDKNTDVYKSLFTTHKSEKEQDRADFRFHPPGACLACDPPTRTQKNVGSMPPQARR